MLAPPAETKAPVIEDDVTPAAALDPQVADRRHPRPGRGPGRHARPGRDAGGHAARRRSRPPVPATPSTAGAAATPAADGGAIAPPATGGAPPAAGGG